jgi:hypothetical protein
MKQHIVCLLFITIGLSAHAQTNIISTNPVAEQIMLGSYNPADYTATTVITNPATISNELNSRISPDSLRSYLEALQAYKNRNTGSDTVSATKGIGAARRWVFNKFQQFSSQNNNRLVVSYLQFDQGICSINQHRNVMAILPGSDLSDKSIIIIEAHIDSRCADVCDTACLAQGMEDNASGTGLVLELARVMSKYTFKNTIVFTTVIGEEQGLYGGQALAMYAQQKGIKIRAVLNNDVIGGIKCGLTSSPPGCTPESLDSFDVRLFSWGGFNSLHKQLSRYIKLQYKEMIKDIAAVPMTINIMTDEDRTGRGGDHIPFRQRGFTAMRFTSANEHGNADVTAPGYNDRQHTSADVLGVDINADMVIDTYYVDFNYLARNAVINANAAAMAAQAVVTPSFNFTAGNAAELTVSITDAVAYNKYRVAIRTTTNDWDSVYTFTGTTLCGLKGLATSTNYIVSVAAVNGDNIESLFSGEQIGKLGVGNVLLANTGIELLQNSPNPADEATMISVKADKDMSNNAYISITDIAGKEIKELPLTLHKGINEVVYEHGFNMAGTYTYTLIIDNKKVASKKMVFSN